jgi:hypothetical protein
MRSLAWFGLLITVCIARAAYSDSDVNEPFLSEFSPPDTRILEAARRGLEEYRDARRYKKEWLIAVNQQRGTIETNWFPEHKGEIRLKVQIVVWGNSFRVDVWQKVGWLYSSIEKTEWSRRTERHIQDVINAQIVTDI